MVSSCGLAGPMEPLSWELSRAGRWLLRKQQKQQAAGPVSLQAWWAVSRGPHPPRGANAAFEVGVADQTPLRPLCTKELYLRGREAMGGK